MRYLGISIMFTIMANSLGCGGQEDGVAAKKDTSEAKLKTPEEPSGTDKKDKMEKKPNIKDIVSEFAPVDVGVPDDQIPDHAKPVLKKLVEAAKEIDLLFLKQVSEKNVAWRRQLAKDPSKSDSLELFDIMYGPWNRLDHNKPFYGTEEKPKGVTFYPRDLTKPQLEKWIDDHPDQKEAFTGYFSVVKRDSSGGLVAVPYAEVYKEHLVPAAKLLSEAAALSTDRRLRKYLASRADAFRSNKYRESDMNWMDLGDGDLEVIIGPYEVYEDELMGYKAAFEAFITLRNGAESKKVAKIKELIPEMKAFLPLPKEHKKSSRGSSLPISVADVIFTAGDTKAGVQTMAFNLPNDEVVREKKGFKLVLLKNISHAKYDKILVPMARQLMLPDQADKISFEAFFNHTLVHETAHGLGPGRIEVERDGQHIETTVNTELQELYPAIEEIKADILGAYLNFLLVEKGLHKEGFMETVYASLLAGFFRAMRFGVNEAHGMANLVQFNWLKEKGAVSEKNGRFVYHSEKMHDSMKSLAQEVLLIEALGDYPGAKSLIENYGKMDKTLAEALENIDGVPTDLNPSFRVEKQMTDW